MSVDEYLEFERRAEFKHEFVGGQVFCMSGASQAHNLVALNLATDINRHLRGGPCRAFINDMKIHLSPMGDDVFYYPDIMVTCDPRDREFTHHIRYPKLIVEVLSPATERIDRREKLFAFMQVPTLEEYVLVEQGRPEAAIHRPTEKWRAQVSTETLELRSIGLSVSLAEIFAGVE